MREEGGIHMRKNDCKLFHLEKIICFLKNLVEYIPVGSILHFFRLNVQKFRYMQRIFKQNLEKCELNGEQFAKFNFISK